MYDDESETAEIDLYNVPCARRPVYRDAGMPVRRTRHRQVLRTRI